MAVPPFTIMTPQSAMLFSNIDYLEIELCSLFFSLFNSILAIGWLVLLFSCDMSLL